MNGSTNQIQQTYKIMTGWAAIIAMALGLALGLFLLNEVYEIVKNHLNKDED